MPYSLSMSSSLSSKTSINHLTPSVSPLQPLCQVDSIVDMIEESNNGGVFLFENERHLLYGNKYICTLCTVWIFGCWICSIPSIVVTVFARIAIRKNQIARAKVMFNIAFIFSFMSLILFAVHAGYLLWLIRYLSHRFLKH